MATRAPSDADAPTADEAPEPRPSTYVSRRSQRERLPAPPPADPPAPPPAEPPGGRGGSGDGPADEPPAPRRRGLARTALRGASTVLVIAGILLVGDAIATVTWQEPITKLLAEQQQGTLKTQLKTLEATGPTRLEQQALDQIDSQSRRLAFRARSLKRRAANGEAVGRLRMPRLGTSQVVVMGTDEGDLKKGPGFYASNPLPGAPGTVAIAGHRTTYGAPFRHVDRLRRGDDITLQMPYATFTYEVERTRIVKPSEVSVLERRRTNRLVLTACHPLFSAAQRIVISARLVRTKPRGSARVTTA